MKKTSSLLCAAVLLTAVSSYSQRVPSFGPNGTHWPPNTPKPGSNIPHVVEVACTWAAIKSAITAATDAQIEAGYHIKVAPGTLPGFGSGSGDTATLRDAGKTGLARNILITPRDGWGTIAMESARFLNVKGVTFARFNGASLRFQDCSQFNWAQSKMSQGIYMQASGQNVTNCNFYEVVIPDAAVSTADRMGFAAGDNRTIRDCLVEGVYCAPYFRKNGSNAHMDTIQMYGNGIYRGLTIRDSVLFGSANCAVQLGGVKASDPNAGTPFFTVDHSILTSLARAMQLRFPLPPGADVPQLSQAINGIGEPWQLFATDTLVFGTMYTTQWASVTNGRSIDSSVATRNPSTVGGWTYDPELAVWSSIQFDEIAPAPTDTYLASIWSDKSGVIAYDGFNYAPTSSINSSADSSTDIGWTGITWGGTNDVVAPGLSYAGLPSEGNAIQFTSGVGSARTIHPDAMPEGHWLTGSDGIKRLGASNSTIWLSVLIRPDLANTDGSKYAALTLLGATNGGTVKLSIGDNGTSPNWSVAKGSTLSASSILSATGTTAFLVARIRFVPGSGNDEVDLFVNPAMGASEPSTPSAMLRGVDIGSFDRLEFKGTRKSTADEVAIGVDWAAVTSR